MPSSPSLSILSLGHPALLHHQTVVSPTSPVPHPHILPSLAARSWQLLYSLVSSCGLHYPGVMTTIRAALRFPHSDTLHCVVLIGCTKRSLIYRIELGEQARSDHEIGDSHRRLRLRKQFSVCCSVVCSGLYIEGTLDGVSPLSPTSSYQNPN